MDTLITAESRFGAAIPVMKYDFASGIRIAAGTTDAASTDDLAAGAYLVTATADVFLSAAGPAGDAPGSMLLAAGVPFHLIIEGGQSISARGVMLDASVFVVPLE